MITCSPLQVYNVALTLDTQLLCRNKTTFYCTMLDATKAFDRVEYCEVVHLLLNTDTEDTVLRSIVLSVK